jgi:ADP-heptose:LPS heptosyltransferase
MKLDIVKNNGSLIKNSSYITSSFDLSKSTLDGVIDKLSRSDILNHSLKKFIKDYRNESELNIINGLGVTLGDSIVGIGAVDCIKKINKNIRISLIRPESCHTYVEEVYYIAKHLFERIEYMPYDINRLSHKAVNIDIGNQLYWKDFNEMEMHDFYLKNLGIDYMNIPSEWKQNHWLQHVIQRKENHKFRYAIFCPNASTKLRAIPEKYHYKIIDELHTTLQVPIVGFSSVSHPKFKNITDQCKSTSDFIRAIANSSYVYTCDSSALHISAAYDIPTTCIFTSVRPELRSKYYKHCTSIYIGDVVTENLHESECPAIIKHVKNKYEEYYENH